MEKYKHQVISVILTILIGMGIGYFVTNTHRQTEIEKLKEEHKKMIEQQNYLLLKATEGRDKKIEELEKRVSEDSLEIVNLKQQQSQVVAQTEKKRKEVRNLSADEKITWLRNRYTNKSQ